MNVLPKKTLTFVTSLSAEEVSSRLAAITAHSIDWEQPNRVDPAKKFYGYVFNNHFQIALRNMRMFSFNPLVQGKIETAGNGSIVFLSLELFILTRVLLWFWSFFIVCTCFFLLQLPIYWLAGNIAALLLLHLVARANFRQHIQPTVSEILNVLEENQNENRENQVG
jgi:hypothetical protein